MNRQDRTKILKSAESYCEAAGIRLTDPRRMVLEIVAASEKPIGAYDVLAQLGKKISNPKPPTAYRALEFLQEHGFIHRIESLNAYIACTTGHKHAGSQFMICDSCGTVSEAHLCQIPTSISGKAHSEGFSLHHWNLELHGTCRDCGGTRPVTIACHTHDHL